MIPKIIHYCWFGGKPKPPLAQKCLQSWSRFCPDYEIIEWNENNFDLSAAPLYVRQAYEAKRWAFVTDYVRLKALTELGGVYLDTDVELLKPLDGFLHHQAFAGFESLQGVQTGLLACQKEFPLFQRFLEHYHTASFLRSDGTADTTTNVAVLTALCRERGLRMDDTYQVVEGLAVYPREVFCPVDYDTLKLKKTRKTVVIHWFSGSWHTEEELQIMAQEKRQLQEEKRSNIRYRIGTTLFGEEGYEKLKEWIRQG